jgi:preprotein translocase subunit SecG
MKTLLIIIYSIVAIVLTILTLIQSKDDEGASGTITGASSSFYEKNKGRTKEGQLKKITIILGVLFIVLAIALGIVY